jgi:hypothetical protein
MAGKEQYSENWWASNIESGFIEIVSQNTGRVICTIDISDYETEEQAKSIAEIIAALPKLLTPSLVIHLIPLLNKA